MKKTTGIIILVILLLGLNSHAQVSFRGIQFIDNENVVAVTSNGYWLISNDGGMNWNGYKVIANNFSFLSDTYMLTPDMGWVIGDYGYVFYSENPTWEWPIQLAGSACSSFDIEMINNGQTGWIGNTHGTCSHTTNYGETWEIQATPLHVATNILGVSIVDENICWMCAGVGASPRNDNYGYIINTYDAGETWEICVSDTLFQLEDIQFINEDHGYCVGGENVNNQAIMYKTSNAGQNWSLHEFPQDEGISFLYSLFFLDATEAWACGENGTIIHTEDAWQTYELQNVGTDLRLNSIEFISPSHGIAGGRNQLLITTDGGETWENRSDFINYSPNSFELYSPYFGQLVDWGTVQFQWEKAVDLGSDDNITYNIYIAEDADFENIIVTDEGLSDTTVTFYNLALEPTSEYWWKVKAFDSTGLGTWCENPKMFLTLELSLHDNDFTSLPTNFSLSPNYPNPFNPTTTITFTIPHSGGNSRGVKLQIYDITGKLVKTLFDETIEPGYYSITWDGQDNSGQDVASGLYFYQIKTEEFTKTRQCLLLK